MLGRGASVRGSVDSRGSEYCLHSPSETLPTCVAASSAPPPACVSAPQAAAVRKPLLQRQANVSLFHFLTLLRLCSCDSARTASVASMATSPTSPHTPTLWQAVLGGPAAFDYEFARSWIAARRAWSLAAVVIYFGTLFVLRRAMKERKAMQLQVCKQIWRRSASFSLFRYLTVVNCRYR